MSPGSCRWAKKRLGAFAGGDLQGRAAARLRLHLRECQGCRGEASGWLQARKALVDGALCGLPASVDEAFFDRLHRQVLAEVAAEAERSEVVRTRRPAWWRIAAAAVVLIGAGWWSVQLLVPDQDLLHRAALPTGTSLPIAGHDGLIRPLADQEWSTETDSDGQGLMGRIKLRTLELDTEPAQANKRRAGPAANPQDRR